MVSDMTYPLWRFIVAFTAGIGLGIFYFGGLWFTLYKANKSRRPALAIMGSFTVRTLIVLAGVLVITKGDWRLVAVWMVGFLLARSFLIRRWGPSTKATHTEATAPENTTQ